MEVREAIIIRIISEIKVINTNIQNGGLYCLQIMQIITIKAIAVQTLFPFHESVNPYLNRNTNWPRAVPNIILNSISSDIFIKQGISTINNTLDHTAGSELKKEETRKATIITEKLLLYGKYRKSGKQKNIQTRVSKV